MSQETRAPLESVNLKNSAGKVPNVVLAERAPTTNEKGLAVGDFFVDKSTDIPYQMTNAAGGSQTWTATSGAAGVPDATTTTLGKVELSTDAEAQAKSGDTVVTAGNLAAEGFLQWADVTLTSAEVKAARATPFELVAAQGAGTAIQLISAQLKLTYGGTNVFTETADNFAIKYTDGSGVAVSETIENTGFIDQSADTYTNALPVADAIVAATGAENQALVLHNTGDGEIAGNAANDNTLTVRVYYVVHSL